MNARHFRFFTSIAAALSVSACSTAAGPIQTTPAQNQFVAPFATNLLHNGSFETPTAPPGGYVGFSTGQTFSHWTVVGAPGNIDLVSGSFTQNGFTFPTPCGAQWLDLTGTSNTATGVSQSVATVKGSQHLLTFEVGNVSNPGGIFGTTSTVNVLIDGAQVFAATNTRGAGQTKMVWKKFTVQFTAQSNTTTVAFINGDPSTDTANGLDCVKLN